MKKILIGLLVICLLLPACAFADTEADQYLIEYYWEMTVGLDDTIRYMNFLPDGTGYMGVPVVSSSYTGEVKSYLEKFNFTWSSFVADDGGDYVTIHFEGEYWGLGWGLGYNPYQYNTYYLIWNPDLMYLLDLNHSGMDAKQFNASKGLTLTQVDWIPFLDF